MDITLHKKSNIEGHIKIKLIPGDYQPKVDEKVKEYSRKANIKGFRKGKVPTGIINKLYGKSIKADEINHLISHSLNDYIKEKDLQLLGDPIPEFEKTEDIDWENQSEFEFEFAIGMVDDFTYEVSHGVKLKKYVIELNDETLQSSIKDIRKQHGKMNNPDTVEDGDVIYGAFKHIESGKDSETSLELSDVRKKDKKKFLGLKKDDLLKFNLRELTDEIVVARLFTMTLDEAKELKGDVELIVKNINRVEPAELNQELYDKVLGPDNVKTEEEFTEKVKETISSNYGRESDYLLNRDIRNRLLEKTKINIPNDFLKRWLKHSNKGKVTQEDIEKDYAHYVDDLKWNLIENQIFRDQKMKVEKEEIAKAARNQIINQLGGPSVADIYKEQLEGIVNNFLQAENGKNYLNIYNQVKDEKIMRFVRENISIADKKVKLEEFKKLVAA